MPETFPMNLENESEVASSPSKHRCYLREICIFFSFSEWAASLLASAVHHTQPACFRWLGLLTN